MPAKNLNRQNGQGIYSYIYNKGVEQRVIFNDDQDYKVFLGFLKDYLTSSQDLESIKKDFTVNGRVFRGTPHQPKNYFDKVELIAYSLMPGHFNLLLHQKTQGSIESFIRSLCTRYSIYFNKKYHRSGALFEGPYKSVQIEDQSRLLQLTGYLHHAEGYSSYPDYLGQRENGWVKSELVLSFLGKGHDGYKQFVEQSKLDPKEKELPTGITFEAKIEHLERRPPVQTFQNYEPQISIQPTENVQNNPPEIPIASSQVPAESLQIPAEPLEKIGLKQNLKPHQRVPEFLAAFVIFFLLMGIGITNIMASPSNSSNQFILGIATTTISTANSPKPIATPTPTPSATPTTVILKTEETNIAPEIIKPKNIVTVKIATGSAKINIHQKPVTNSKTIGKAKNGDTFELVAIDSGWYEVQLANGSIGFILSKYINIEESNTNE